MQAELRSAREAVQATLTLTLTLTLGRLTLTLTLSTTVQATATAAYYPLAPLPLSRPLTDDASSDDAQEDAGPKERSRV